MTSYTMDRTIPMLKIIKKIDGSAYGIEGFDAINRWAMMYDPTWVRVFLENINMQREDILTVLCVALLREKHGQLYKLETTKESQPGMKGGE